MQKGERHHKTKLIPSNNVGF